MALIYKVDTGSNLADLFTKLLDRVKRKEIIQMILYEWKIKCKPLVYFQRRELITTYPTIRYQYQPYGINTYYLIYHTPLEIKLKSQQRQFKTNLSIDIL